MQIIKELLQLGRGIEVMFPFARQPRSERRMVTLSSSHQPLSAGALFTSTQKEENWEQAWAAVGPEPQDPEGVAAPGSAAGTVVTELSLLADALLEQQQRLRKVCREGLPGPPMGASPVW